MNAVPAPTTLRLTSGPQHHFFGYYEKTPWSLDGARLLSLEALWFNRMPEVDEPASVGLLDLTSGVFRVLAQTRAWNWQQGCMLQWLGTDANRLIIYNDRRDGRFVSVIRNIEDGSERVLPRPVYAVSASGEFAMTVNFSRYNRYRPVTGYAGTHDESTRHSCPADDGIYRMDLKTGESRMVLSLAQAAALKPADSMNGANHWFEHLVLNPTATRLIFLHRWSNPQTKGFFTRMYTMNVDGSDVYCLADTGKVSHFDWRGPDKILAWARQPGAGDHFYVFHDRSDRVEPFAHDVLPVDGHCSFSPDGRWLLTDTYPNAERIVTLILYRPADGKYVEIGKFHSPPEYNGNLRCDLHPRWNRDGTQVCIDSTHEGSRQIYVIDVSAVVKG